MIRMFLKENNKKKVAGCFIQTVLGGNVNIANLSALHKQAKRPSILLKQTASLEDSYGN